MHGSLFLTLIPRLIPKWGVGLALVLECYGHAKKIHGMQKRRKIPIPLGLAYIDSFFVQHSIAYIYWIWIGNGGLLLPPKGRLYTYITRNA
jgi:hypothetical protein